MANQDRALSPMEAQSVMYQRFVSEKEGAGVARRRKLMLVIGSLVVVLATGLSVACWFFVDRANRDNRSSSASGDTVSNYFALSQIHLFNKTNGIRSYAVTASREYVIPSTLAPGAAGVLASRGVLNPANLQLDQDTLYMLATFSQQAYNEQNANPIVCDEVAQQCAAAEDNNQNLAMYTQNNVVALVYQELSLSSSDYQNALNGQPVQNFNPTGNIAIAFKGTDPASFNDLYSDDYIYRCPSQSGFAAAQSTSTGPGSYDQASQVIVQSVLNHFSPSGVVFTGHSLGGTLAMLNFALQGMQDSVCVPFSAPPSGLIFEYLGLPTGDVQGIYEFYTQGDPFGGGTSVVNAQCYPGQVGVYPDTTGCYYIGCHSINTLLQNIAAESVPSFGFPNDNTCLPCGTF